MRDSIGPIAVTGVSGSGKSTVGALLAARVGVDFVDGDDLHPLRNRERMAAGIPLTDEDREPWLHAVGKVLATYPGGVVVACSALKRAYRDLLRGHAAHLYVVELDGSYELIAERVRARTHSFMPPALLRSQFRDLEPLQADECGVRVDVRLDPAQIVAEVLQARSG